MPGECRPTPKWHGFAAQDTRTPSSTGFRRRCAAWRVTLERPKVTKGLIPHLFALLRRVPSVHPFVPRPAPMGHPSPAPLARHPASRPGQTVSPRRTTGGNPVPSAPRPVNRHLSIWGKDWEEDYHPPRPPHGKSRLSHLCNKRHRHGCIGEKNHGGITH